MTGQGMIPFALGVDMEPYYALFEGSDTRGDTGWIRVFADALEEMHHDI